jgi:hypothetical protein
MHYQPIAKFCVSVHTTALYAHCLEFILLKPDKPFKRCIRRRIKFKRIVYACLIVRTNNCAKRHCYVAIPYTKKKYPYNNRIISIEGTFLGTHCINQIWRSVVSTISNHA